MDTLSEAAGDLRWLLERGYPRDRALAMAGDRWDLNAEQRHILHRAVFAPSQARRRAGMLLPPGSLAGQWVAVDGHNVIITLQSALTGRILVWGDDGVLRDVRGLGKNHKPDEDTTRAARLMLEGLGKHRPARVLVLLHRRLPLSGRLAMELDGMMEELGLNGQARVSGSVRRELAGHPGPVASGDSALLDRVAAPLDLAGLLVREFKPAPAGIRLS